MHGNCICDSNAQRVRCLLRTYEELKFLGHPEYQLFVKKFKSSILDNTLEKEVYINYNCIHACTGAAAPF